MSLLWRKEDRKLKTVENSPLTKFDKALVFSGLGLSLCLFWFVLMCRGILGAVITTFLGFVGHCTVDIFRRSLVPRLY